MHKHLRRLGLFSGADYLRWCRRRGFDACFRKSWEELEEEWSAHRREIEKAQARAKVDRDPVKLIARVCAGTLRADQIARPRWRALAERVELEALRPHETRALRALVEVAAKRGRFLLAEGEIAGQRLPYLDALLELARHHEVWIRDPARWRPKTHNAERQLASLIRHQLARFPVPQFMDAAWLRRDEVAGEYRVWFCAIGSGENLRKREGPIDWTNRTVHWFLRAPSQLSIEQALRWGQVRAEGGSEALARAVVASRLGRTFEHDDFWVSVIRFFARRPELEASQFGPVVDYLHHQKFVDSEAFVAPGVRERRPPVHPNLSMQGRTPQALLRDVERWHRALARAPADGPRAWPSSGVAGFEWVVGVEGKNLHVWKIRELCSAAALRAEGARMRHCVSSYAYACKRGACSIWSMEVDSFRGCDPRVTIEVTRAGQIVQVRGKANRKASERELDVIRRWAAKEGLQLAAIVG